jgi:hypothetical protein
VSTTDAVLSVAFFLTVFGLGLEIGFAFAAGLVTALAFAAGLGFDVDFNPAGTTLAAPSTGATNLVSG